MNEEQALLSVEGVTVEFQTRAGLFPVLDGLDFELRPRETLCLVGESGCGKSMTALAIMGLVPSPPGRISAGRIVLDGEDLVAASEARMREVRGKQVSMIFQEPMTSLNPVYTIGEQIAEVLRLHEGMGRRAAWDRATELLDAVRIPTPSRRVHDHPHLLSGGQRQRVMIAMALACRPRLLIADEPTTALDVTVQAEIFELLHGLREETGTAILLITHDMGVVAEMGDRVVVMYAGRKAEEGAVADVLNRPRHPYTKGLIASVPHVSDDPTAHERELMEIPGIVPGIESFGVDACLFAPRCAYAEPGCTAARPATFNAGPAHRVTCARAEALRPGELSP